MTSGENIMNFSAALVTVRWCRIVFAPVRGTVGVRLSGATAGRQGDGMDASPCGDAASRGCHRVKSSTMPAIFSAANASIRRAAAPHIAT